MNYYDGPLFKITSTCKGGGYRYCRTIPPHPKRNSKGLYPLHRVLMTNKVGRILGSDEVVHHEDDDKTNNRIGNLRLKTRAGHSRDHARRVDPVECVCGQCGRSFWLKPHKKRLRVKRTANGVLYCNRECWRLSLTTEIGRVG